MWNFCGVVCVKGYGCWLISKELEALQAISEPWPPDEISLHEWKELMTGTEQGSARSRDR